MRQNLTYQKIRDYVLSRTWTQLNEITKQEVVDAFIATGDPLSTDDIEQLTIRLRRKAIFRSLKNEWIRLQRTDFIDNRYLPAFRAAINPSLNSYTVQQVYDYTISEGLSVETADSIYKEAVSTYRGEL